MLKRPSNNEVDTQGIATTGAIPAKSSSGAVAYTEPRVDSGQELTEANLDRSESAIGGKRWLSADSQAFLVSLAVHLLLLFALAMFPVIRHHTQQMRLVSTDESQPMEEFRLIEKVVAAEMPADQVGANSDGRQSAAAMSAAAVLADLSELPSPGQEESVTPVTFSMTPNIPASMGLVRSLTAVKGATGVGESGLDGAVDRLTFEILRSMEESPTLVVWLFDQSGSLTRQRQEIRDRFDRIYEELGILAQSYSRRDFNESRLLTAVIGYGQSAQLLTPRPTADLSEIRSAIDSIQEDTSGVERVFAALQLGLKQFKAYRTGRSGRGDSRNVLFVVVTDERGDDPQMLENTIRECQKFAIPVYVLGVPAPFGRDIAYLKYIDPDPQFDQTPEWAEVDQGPESVLPERVRLGFKDDKRFEEPVIDSGFGPFALSRLTYETGGLFFTIHPNRRLTGNVSRSEIAPFASDIQYFFDPEVMEKYRPDYVSESEYLKLVKESPMRFGLIQAVRASNGYLLDDPETRFVKRDEAFLATSLTVAQQLPAQILPDLEKVANILREAESHRDREVSPRWLAAMDLSLGTVLAHQVRAAVYNEMLAKAKRGMKFEDPRNNTWVLVPAPEITVGSRLEKEGQKAVELLRHVADKHRGTPWGLLAARELENPIGWRWTEEYTDLAPPLPQNMPPNVNPPPPMNDQIRMLAPPPPKRPLPKL